MRQPTIRERDVILDLAVREAKETGKRFVYSSKFKQNETPKKEDS